MIKRSEKRDRLARMQRLVAYTPDRARRDSEDNAATRLHADEEVHLAAVSVAEVFTPSKVNALLDAADALPFQSLEANEKLKRELLLSRRNTLGSSWGTLATVRRQGDLLGDNYYRDETLPDSIDAIWIRYHAPTPSLTIVVAVFSISPEAGDLSATMKQDYRTEYDPKYRRGRKEPSCIRMPWSIPEAPRGYAVYWPRDVRKRRCESLMDKHQDSCIDWMNAHFRGKFSDLANRDRPGARSIITKNARPYTGTADERTRLYPVTSASMFDVWFTSRGANAPGGWAIATDDSLSRPSRLQAVARAAEVIGDDGDPPHSPPSWIASQDFQERCGDLVSKYAVSELLSKYSHVLVELRDRATTETDPTVAGEKLSQYMLEEGLDITTVSAELLNGFGLPEIESDYHLSTRDWGYDAGQPSLDDRLNEIIELRAKALSRDYQSTVSVISAYSQLSQANNNLKLQQKVVRLTKLTIALAVVGIVIGACQAYEAVKQESWWPHGTDARPAVGNQQTKQPLQPEILTTKESK